MPTFRSKDDRSIPAGFAFSSSLPVTSRLTMLRFFPHAFRIKRSLDATMADAGGVLSYRLVADVKGKTFEVTSTWRDEKAFRQWVGSDVHRIAMTSLGPRVEGGTFHSEVLGQSPAA